MSRNNISTTARPAGDVLDGREAGVTTETNDWGVDKIAGSDLVLALYGVICAVGVAGNLLVCFVLLRVPSLRSNTSHFMIHLSFVDLVVCLLVVPFKIVPPLALRSPPPQASPSPSASPGTAAAAGVVTVGARLWCRLYVSQYVFWVCTLASTYSLVAVNLERFVAIVHPHRYKRVFERRRNKLLIIASCWLLVALSKSYILFLYREDETDGCKFQGWPSLAVQSAMGVYTFVFNLFAPFWLMVLGQWRVISRLRRQVRTLTERTGSLGMSSTDKRKMWQLRTTQTLLRTLLAFVLTFAACWTPNSVMFLFYNLGGRFSFASPAYHCGVILAVGNSCVNPVIYAATNQAFRRGLRQAFLGKRRSARRVGDGSMSVSMSVSATQRDETK